MVSELEGKNTLPVLQVKKLDTLAILQLKGSKEVAGFYLLRKITSLLKML